MDLPRCTKCGEKPITMPRWTGKENSYVGYCPHCDNEEAEFVGDTTQWYEGDDYAGLY